MIRGRAVFATVLALVAAVLLAVAGAAGWVLYTPSGFAWLAAQLAGYAGEGLTLEGTSGTLAHGARLAAIRYVGEDIEGDVRDAALALSPASLFRLAPRIDYMRAEQISVRTRPGEPRGRPPDTLELPLDIELVESHIGRLVVNLGEGPLDLADVRLAYAGGKTRHTVRELTLSGFGHAVAMRGTIDAQAPFAIDAAVTAVRRESPPGSAYARIDGTLTALAAKGGARLREARLQATVALRPYDALPIASVKADLAGVST